MFTLDLYMNLEMTYWRLKNLVKSQHEGMNTAVVHELSGNSQVTWFEFALRSAMTKGNNFVLHIFIENMSTNISACDSGLITPRQRNRVLFCRQMEVAQLSFFKLLST